MPQLRQANFSEKSSVSPSPSTISISTRPPAIAGRRLDRLGEAPPQVGLHHQAVDDDRDVVFVLLVEDYLLVEAAQLAVDQGPRVALEPHLLEQFPVLAFAAADDRRHDHEFGPLLERHQPVDDLLLGLAGDLGPALGAVRGADPRPEQAQVVVDLGHRADRRARVARGRLLVDRDRRREAFDRVDVGLLHQAEELARVGRERLDVAPLPLGVDRVEGEARLARAGEPGDHDQRVSRQLDVDVLEVVLTGAGDDDSLRSSHCQRVYPGEQMFPWGEIPPSSHLLPLCGKKCDLSGRCGAGGRQHGVVFHRQLGELGDRGGVDRGRGLGRAGCTGSTAASTRSATRAISRQGHLPGAVLACGAGALLSHASAAWLWGLIARFAEADRRDRPRHDRHRRRDRRGSSAPRPGAGGQDRGRWRSRSQRSTNPAGLRGHRDASTRRQARSSGPSDSVCSTSARSTRAHPATAGSCRESRRFAQAARDLPRPRVHPLRLGAPASSIS